NKASHAFLAFDIGAIQTKDEYENAMDAYIDNIKQSPKAKGSGGIYMPGEIEFSKKKKADKTGIPLTDDVVQSLEQLANSSGLKLNWK
ncbi:MAG: hypothetical protein HN948_07465, partial [Clostridia bacterium]|nr:hypothetical protein [Clostridia bacterium]